MTGEWKRQVSALLKPHGEVREFSSADFGRERVEGALSILLDGGEAMVVDEAIDVLREIRAGLPNGVVALLGTVRWLGDDAPDGKVELFVAPGNDQLDAVRWARTDAVNYGHDTEAVVAWLAQLNARFGLDVFRAETDAVEAFVTGKGTDWAALAKELYAFCPDVVDQGVGSIDELERALSADGRVFLWWD